MNGLPAETTQSWFFVKAAVALSPILTFWIADIIAWFLRRTLGGTPEGDPQTGREPAREEPAGVAAPPW
jgi:CDP-diglyceride synthetase